MSVPPEVMQQMMGAQGGGQGGAAPGAPPAQMPGSPAAAPAAAPMPKPQEKEGKKAAAQTNIHIAMNMLEEALPVFGAESKEGQKLMRALTVLGTLAAKRDSSDLVPAEVLQMVRQMPQMGGGTDIQKMLMQQMKGAGGAQPPQGGKPPGM